MRLWAGGRALTLFFVGGTADFGVGTVFGGAKPCFCSPDFMSSELEASEVAAEPLDGGAGASGIGDWTSSLTEAKYPLFWVWRPDNFLKLASLEESCSREEPEDPDDTEGEDEPDEAETTDEGASGTCWPAFCGFFNAGMARWCGLLFLLSLSLSPSSSSDMETGVGGLWRPDIKDSEGCEALEGYAE